MLFLFRTADRRPHPPIGSLSIWIEFRVASSKQSICTFGLRERCTPPPSQMCGVKGGDLQWLHINPAHLPSPAQWPALLPNCLPSIFPQVLTFIFKRGEFLWHLASQPGHGLVLKHRLTSLFYFVPDTEKYKQTSISRKKYQILCNIFADIYLTLWEKYILHLGRNTFYNFTWAGCGLTEQADQEGEPHWTCYRLSTSSACKVSSKSLRVSRNISKYLQSILKVSHLTRATWHTGPATPWCLEPEQGWKISNWK